MTRIIGGELGGRRLAVPSGGSTRPTSDRTREALFSSLSATHDVETGVFLDLYAGSGAVGLEALSRGAPRVVLVESSKVAARVIERNVRELQAVDRARVIQGRVRTALSTVRGLDAATVFLDPPYGDDSRDVAEVVRRLVDEHVINADGLIVLERDRRSDWQWPDGVQPVRERRYGETVLWYGRPL